MTDLERAIAEILDYPSVFMGGPSRLSLRKAEAIVAMLNERISTRQLVPAQVWQPIETMPDCVEVLVWARGWESPSIGFASDGVGPYDPISGGEFDPWPTHWMPLPPPPAEGV